MKLVSRLVLISVALTALLTAGCAGMMLRSFATEDVPFNKTRETLPPIPEDKARVWLYSIGGGPNVFDSAGHFTTISIGQSIYQLLGHAYSYVDVPAGNTRFTTSDTCPRRFGAGCGPGRIRKSIDLNGGSEYFIRISMPESHPLSNVAYAAEPDFPIDEVDLSTASREMQAFAYIKQSSKQSKIVWHEERGAAPAGSHQ